MLHRSSSSAFVRIFWLSLRKYSYETKDEDYEEPNLHLVRALTLTTASLHGHRKERIAGMAIQPYGHLGDLATLRLTVSKFVSSA